MSAFLHRLAGVALLDPATFEDVEADASATPQALAVVVASSLAAGIGAKGVEGAQATLTFFAAASVIALLAWAAWALITFEIGARILKTPETHADADQLLRTLGFAAAPGLIQVAGVFPGARAPAFTLAVIWALAASVMAVKHSLDYKSTGRALAVCILAAALAMASAIMLSMTFSPALSGLEELRWHLI